jgi:hypothetical protein
MNEKASDHQIPAILLTTPFFFTLTHKTITHSTASIYISKLVLQPLSVYEHGLKGGSELKLERPYNSMEYI